MPTRPSPLLKRYICGEKNRDGPIRREKKGKGEEIDRTK
jgi:hypothetical protein